MDVLVRARQAREDAAQAQLSGARRHAADTHRAAAHADDQVTRLAGKTPANDDLSALSFVAASAAVQAAAATRSLALFAAAQAELAVEQRRETLRDAAMDTAAAENLLERAAIAERAHAERVQQRDLDEVAATGHQRRRAELA